MRILCALVLLVGCVSMARAEEKSVDNPAYPVWAKQKVGTTLTVKNVTEAAGQKTESLMTYKLLEIKPEKVVLEITSKTILMGMEFAGPPSKMEIEKTTKVTVDPKAQEAAEKAKKNYATTNGEETLKIGGKDYKCKWSKVKGATDGVEYESTTWTSDEIPNLMVKMNSKSTGKDINSTTTIEVTEFKTP